MAALIPICFGIMGSVALGQASASNVHPVIGDKPPEELLASDILALPEREQQAWTHGAITLLAQAWFESDKDKALCVLDWYFEGDASEVLDRLFETYSDRAPTSIVYAAANNACSTN